MMTLDEAIKHCKEKSCGNTECALEHKQLAEWLTELKGLRVNNRVQKIREKLARLKDETSIGLSEHENGIEQGRMEIINALSIFLDSIQEEPVSPCDTCPGNELTGTCASISELGRCPLKYRKAYVWHPVSQKPVYDKTEGALNLIAVSGIVRSSEGHFSMSVVSLLEDGRIFSPISGKSYVFDDCYFTKWAYIDDLLKL